MDSTKHDDMLFEMLKECKSLPIFLDHIFGFLNRRTDFYHVTKEPNSPVGLPPGLAERVVKQCFDKWKPEKQTAESYAELTENNLQPDIKPPSHISHKTHEKFTTSDSYNGAVFENYTWSQTISEVDVVVKIPEGVTWKDLFVKVHPDRISVKMKDDTVLLEGELCNKCKHKEAIWSVQKSKLEIHLDKCQELWWNCLIKSEPKLNVNELDCSRPFEELPEEAQVKIEELQWNQERKRLGLPTSDEMAMHSILKQSWNAKGSPFSGPFDPSAVKFN